LQWWKDYAKQFFNVSFLACQFLSIPSFHIEIEWIFNIVGILKVEDKMLDNFEEELEDVGYFDSLE
jgi:hypothetical protein